MHLVNYRKLNLKNLRAKEYSHLKLLIFWPINGLIFNALESFRTSGFHRIESPLDAYIPFCEYFVIPYLGWFLFLPGMLLYGLLADIPAFKRYMWFTIVTYSCTNLIYLVYPNAQYLRPASFTNNTVFTQAVSLIYAHDTNTNVCPSLHVTGSIAVIWAAWNSKRFRTSGWRLAFVAVGSLIAISTVFMKQHSIIDVFCSIVLCLVAYPFVRRLSSPGESTYGPSRQVHDSSR